MPLLVACIFFTNPTTQPPPDIAWKETMLNAAWNRQMAFVKKYGLQISLVSLRTDQKKCTCSLAIVFINPATWPTHEIAQYSIKEAKESF